jgi:drug/metabolite transporter (DMT)-like permease
MALEGTAGRPADNARLGILLMVVASALWTLHDAISKDLTQHYSVFQILFVRSVFAFIPLLFFIWRDGGFATVATRRPLANLGRGLVGVTSFSLFLFALPLMPLANVFAIGMSSPLIITALSGPLLGERVSGRQWAAVLVGFAAVLVMLRPGGDMVPLAVALVLASNLCYALGMTLTRTLGRTESAATMTLFGSLVFLTVGATVTPFVWVTPALFDFGLMAFIGLIAGLAQYSMTQAFRIAPPATVTPFEYTCMVWAVLLGLAIWGDVPSWSVLGGATVIVLSGLYIVRTNR